MVKKDLRAGPADPVAYQLALDRLALMLKTAEVQGEDDLSELPELPSEDEDVVAELRRR